MNFDFRTHVGMNMALAADAVDGDVWGVDYFHGL